MTPPSPVTSLRTAPTCPSSPLSNELVAMTGCQAGRPSNSRTTDHTFSIGASMTMDR